MKIKIKTIDDTTWPCPELCGEKISAETCLDCYLDALDYIDEEPDNFCLHCDAAKRGLDVIKNESYLSKVTAPFHKSDDKKKLDVSNGSELADQHWQYISNLLAVSMPQERFDMMIDSIAFHYRTAFLHGYKHGIEAMEARE